MGDPRKHRKKYSTPRHPWEKERIDLESSLVSKYALKTKKEIWKMQSILTNMKNQAKKLSTVNTSQGEIESKQLLNRIVNLGLVSSDQDLDVVLTLTIDKIMDRRIQSLVKEKGYARTMMQSRQFITHRHIQIGDKTITSPSYLVSISEEPKIGFKGRSSFSDTNHPERVVAAKVKKAKKKDRVDDKKSKVEDKKDE